MTIRRLSWLAAGVATVAVAACSRASQTTTSFPDRPLTLIVAYAAGGGTDTTARLLAQGLGTAIGQPVIVENISGGGGWTGWSAIAHARPDGYTIGYINAPNIFAGYLDPNVGRPERLESFTLLMNHVTDYCIWAVRRDSPFKGVADLVAAANATPERVSITAHGYGGDDHLAIMAMGEASGARFKVVHNKGTAESKAQVLGGHVDVLAANVSEVVAEQAAGELRILGVMAPARSPFLPDVPTFKEQGFDQDWSVSRGIVAPNGLPADRLKALAAALESTLTGEAHRAGAARLGFAPELIKGPMYLDFLKTKEQRVKALMGW